MTTNNTTSFKGWYRRNDHSLPHFDCDCIQFVTFRLVDSLPKIWFENLIEAHRVGQISKIEYYQRIEKYLAAGLGEKWLANSKVAQMVQDTLKYFHEKRYLLHSWVIMPNHVHMLISILPGNNLPDIVRTIKSYTARKANIKIGRCGPFWQRDFFDRYIRNIKHFDYTVAYIEYNPVVAGLCKQPSEWQFGSAFGEESL